MSHRTLSAHAHLVIPMPPLRAPAAPPRLGPIQEASLVGILSLGGFWALAELAFLILG